MSSRVFAVDLGAWSVKVAVVSPGLRSVALLRVVERLVPPGDEPAETRARRTLGQLVTELGLRGEAGYLGVYGDQVFTQVLDFPFKSLRRAELDRAVGAELEGVVPVDLEDMVYCFEPLPAAPTEVVEPGAELPRGRIAPVVEGMRVLSYAMRRTRAEALIGIGAELGFEARGVLACAGAAVRLVDRTPSLRDARQAGPVAVIDVGHERTDVIVVVGGKAVFSRSVARAGRHVTDAIARHWKMSVAEAERAKHSDGFVASAAEPATSDAWARIHEVTVSELAPFARDLRQTVAACRARTGHQVGAALLVGGGARLRGVASYLTEQLGVPAWRPTAEDVAALGGPKLDPDGAATLDAAALTVGMALDAGSGRPMFDLRSGALARGVDLSFLRGKAGWIAASAFSIAVFAAGAGYANLYRLRHADKILTPRLAQESAELFGEARSAKAINGGTEANSAAPISPLPKMSAYDVLLEISQKVPPRDKIALDVDRLDITDSKVEMAGSAKTPEEVDALVTELKKIDCFKDVTRGPSETGENGVKKFKLTISAACM